MTTIYPSPRLVVSGPMGGQLAATTRTGILNVMLPREPIPFPVPPDAAISPWYQHLRAETIGVGGRRFRVWTEDATEEASSAAILALIDADPAKVAAVEVLEPTL